MLIYALLLLKCRESNLHAFLIHNLNFARLFARLTHVFLLKKSPSFACIFTKMSPSEELGTLSNLFILYLEILEVCDFGGILKSFILFHTFVHKTVFQHSILGIAPI